jgi:hypothetical protein
MNFSPPFPDCSWLGLSTVVLEGQFGIYRGLSRRLLLLASARGGWVSSVEVADV